MKRLPKLGISGFLTKIRGPQKKKYICNGGPMDGHVLWLSSPSTLHMNFNGTTGRYAKNGALSVTWEQTHAF